MQGNPGRGNHQGADRESLSGREAQARTGIAAADFLRIRNADLGRFTVDRLMCIINRLGSRVDVALSLQRIRLGEHGVEAMPLPGGNLLPAPRE
jgi:hypothetical protein